MVRIGFKAFDKGLINRYGVKFKLNTKYSVSGEIKWGNDGNGFHFCTHLEDCLRYIDGINREIDMTIVKCDGDMYEYWDDYYGYYDMFVARNMEIIKVMTREEIINYMLKRCEFSKLRFIQGYFLTEEEVQLFRTSYWLDSGIGNYNKLYSKKLS